VDKLGCKNEGPQRDVRLAPDNRTVVVDGLAIWQGRKGEKVDLADVEAAAYDASVQRRAPVWFDPFQAVQLGQTQSSEPARVSGLLGQTHRPRQSVGGPAESARMTPRGAGARRPPRPRADPIRTCRRRPRVGRGQDSAPSGRGGGARGPSG